MLNLTLGNDPVIISSPFFYNTKNIPPVSILKNMPPYTLLKKNEILGLFPLNTPINSGWGNHLRHSINLKIIIMVKIIDYRKRENKDGEEFFALIIEGGLEMVKSKQTGRYYATSKKASVTSTFDEETCMGLIGKKKYTR